MTKSLLWPISGN